MVFHSSIVRSVSVCIEGLAQLPLIPRYQWLVLYTSGFNGMEWNSMEFFFFPNPGNNKQQLYKSRFHLLISPGKCVHQSLALRHEMGGGKKKRQEG